MIDQKTASEATFKLWIFRLGLMRHHFLLGIGPVMKANSSCVNTIAFLKDQVYRDHFGHGNLYLLSSFDDSDSMLQVLKHSNFHRNLGK